MPIARDEDILKNSTPHIAVGTPGRVLDLVNKGFLKLKHLKYFILDECDMMIGHEGESIPKLSIPNLLTVPFSDMRYEVVEIFKQTPREKQTMMFSATLSKDMRKLCKKFMRDVSSSGISGASSKAQASISAAGGVHRRLFEADSSRPPAVLRAHPREREEREAARPAGRPRVQSG